MIKAMNKKLEEYFSQLGSENTNLSTEREALLRQVIAYVQDSESPKLNFICTHNSRRSHLSQIWAQTLANHYGVRLETFSGGTEATAFHPNAVAALLRAGFEIRKEGEENPRYQVYFDAAADPIVAYSKRFEEPPNPSSGFAAIMTCSEADAECPVVFGAETRIKLFYEDPKVADGTSEEAAKYDERCLQIAKEMNFIFSQIKG